VGDREDGPVGHATAGAPPDPVAAPGPVPYRRARSWDPLKYLRRFQTATQLRPRPYLAVLPDIIGVSKGEQGSSRVVVNFVKTNGAYTATVQFIDIPIEPFRAANVACNFPSLRIDVAPDHWYEGKFSADAKEISGTVHAGANSFPLSLKRTATPSPSPKILADTDCRPRAGSDLQGRWQGVLGNGVNAVHVVVKISEPSSGKFDAQLDNLSGPWLRQPLLVAYEEGEVELTVASRAGMFQGNLTEDHSKMNGKWMQGGRKVPARFWRDDQ